MGLFSNPFKTMGAKLKNLFNPRDKAFVETQKSIAKDKAAITKDKRITRSFHYSWSQNKRLGVISRVRSRLLQNVKKTDLNTTTIRYFGTFRPIRYFRSGNVQLRKRRAITQVLQ